MRPDELVLANVVQLTLLVVVMIGLWVRSRAGLCRSFCFYIAAVTTDTILLPLWPERFWTFPVFVVKEVVFAVIKMAVAVEIWHWTFATFPVARVRVGLLLVVVLALIALATAPPAGLDFYDSFTGVSNPRQQAGVLVLCIVIVSASAWYRVPLHPYHRALGADDGIRLLPDDPRALADAVFFGLAETRAGWGFELLVILEAVGYPLTLAWWVRAVWRPPYSSSEIVSKLQPWAHSW